MNVLSLSLNGVWYVDTTTGVKSVSTNVPDKTHHVPKHAPSIGEHVCAAARPGMQSKQTQLVSLEAVQGCFAGVPVEP